MRDLALSAVDLNLLVVLQALLNERHVTRAGSRLAMSQPAVSRALARLREIFDDELLVRDGQRMRLTTRAQSLAGALDRVLGEVADLIAPSDFDPATATGRLRVAAPDILTYGLAPPLLRVLAREAPALDVEVVPWDFDWRAQLASGDVDLTIGQPVGHEPNLHSVLLARNDWACVLRRGHPVLRTRKRWTAELYATLPHLLIAFTPHGGGHVDEALGARGLTRRVALRMPYVTLSPLLIAETDLVLTTARWLARKLAGSVGLVIKDPPIPLAPVDLPMVWHARTHGDPRQRWFRATLARLAREVGLLPGTIRQADGQYDDKSSLT